mgnify:CR=1 FL=1
MSSTHLPEDPQIASWYSNLVRDPTIREICGVPPDCPFREFVSGHLDQWATQSQLHWLLDRQGRLPFHRIIHFDRLAAEMAEIAPLLHIQSSLPRLNAGDGRPYAEWYDADTRDMVGRRYAAEIAQFGFRYGE